MKQLRCELVKNGMYVEHFSLIDDWESKVKEWVKKIDPEKGTKLLMYMSESNACFTKTTVLVNGEYVMVPDKIIII